MIYFVQAGEDGPIKIGRAENVRSRVIGLQSSAAVQLTLLAWMPGGADEEVALHARFARWRRRGEWFDPADDLIAFVTGPETRAAPALPPPAGAGAVDAGLHGRHAQELVELLAAALNAVFGQHPQPAKMVARLADVNAATAKNWLGGKVAPSAQPLLRLMAAHKRFGALVFALSDATGRALAEKTSIAAQLEARARAAP